MSNYNVQTLSFLIGSFNQMKSTFGENSKTVGFFRNQVQGLVEIGQVGLSDAEFVFGLIGMLNTDNVKWEPSNKRVDMFITAMNSLVSVVDNSVKAYILKDMTVKKVITQEICDMIATIFNLRLENVYSKKEQNFGVLKKINPTDCNLKSNQVSVKTQWDNFVRLCESHHRVRVKNLGAVCMHDPTYFYVDVEKFLSSNLFDSVIKGAPCDIVYEVANTDPCSCRRIYNVDKVLTDKLHQIDLVALKLNTFKLD